MPKLSLTLDTEDLRELVTKYLRQRVNDADLDPMMVRIEVKSKQNYKSEWEAAEFRAVLEVKE